MKYFNQQKFILMMILSFKIGSECYLQNEIIGEVQKLQKPLTIFNLGLNEEIEKNNETEERFNLTLMDHMMGLRDKRFKTRRLNSPCSCEFVDEVLDLGANSYPRYHSQKICVKNSRSHCTHGSTCKEFEHKVLVLKLLNEDDVGSSEKFINEIGLKYSWSLVNIKIDCRCTH